MEITRIADMSLQATVPDVSKTEQAAEEFEAILLGQMLQSARETGSGSWLSSEEDRASSAALEFAEQQVAKMMAQSGGLGLARMVSKQLAAHRAAE